MSHKPNVGESYDMNHLLENLSYSRKDSNALHQKSVIIEVPSQEAGTTATLALQDSRFVQDLFGSKQTSYPCPLPSYDPKKSPPDLAKAEKHALSQRVVKFDPVNPPSEVSESTGVPIQRAGGFGLCCDMRKLSHLGPVISMYFLFVKQLAFVFFLFCCLGAAILLTGKKADFSSYEKSMDGVIQDSQQALRFLICIFSMLVFLCALMYIYRKNQKTAKLACKKTLITPSDYTVMAFDMGRIYTEEEVRAFFSNYIVPNFSLDVQKVVATQDIEKYVDRVRELKLLLKSKAEAEKVANYISNGVVDEIQNKIDEIKDYFSNNKKLLAGYRGFKRNGTCFVSYATKQEAKTVRRKFEFSVLERGIIWILEKCTDEFPEYFFKDQYLKVVKAPEINEILWEKLNCNTGRKGKRFLNIVIFSILMAINFISAYYIRTSQQEKAYDYYRVYVVAVITAFQNEVIASAVAFLSRLDAFKTITEAHIAVQRKTVLLQLINSAGPLLLLEYVFSDKTKNTIDEYFASDVVIIGFAITFLPLIIRMLNFPYRFRQSLKARIVKQVQSNSIGGGVTQEEANHAHENPEFDINRVYVDTVRTFLFTCLFFCVSPAVALVAFIGFIVGFLVDKYNLLQKSIMPTVLRSEIAEAMFEFVDLGLFLFAVSGNIFLDFVKDDNTSPDFSNIGNTLSVFTTIIAGLYLMLPNKRYVRNVFPTKKPIAWPSLLVYQQAQEYFPQDYQSANPVAKDLTNAKDFLVQYKDTYNTYKAIDMLQEVPEILPIFNYAEKRPAFSEVREGVHDGLKNPYYSFPQNYKFGFDADGIAYSDNNSTISSPLMDNQETRRDFRKSLENKQRQTEMSPIGSQSLNGNSVLKDLKMFPNAQEGTTPSEFELRESHDSYHLPVFGGAESVNDHEDNGPTGFTLSSHDAGAILEGISPIQGGSYNQKLKR